jgi:hypothetical protein
MKYQLALLLAVFAVACGSKETTAPTNEPSDIQRSAADAAANPGDAPMATASESLDTEEQKILDGVPTMEEAADQAAKDITEANADALLAEIRKELGGGN